MLNLSSRCSGVVRPWKSIRCRNLKLSQPLAFSSIFLAEEVEKRRMKYSYCTTWAFVLVKHRTPSFLSGTASDDPLKQLYQLYDQILNVAIDFAHADNSVVLRVVLGTICVTADNRSLSVGAMSVFVTIDPRLLMKTSTQYGIRSWHFVRAPTDCSSLQCTWVVCCTKWKAQQSAS